MFKLFIKIDRSVMKIAIINLNRLRPLPSSCPASPTPGGKIWPLCNLSSKLNVTGAGESSGCQHLLSPASLIK